jgi:hypothetical protein
MATREEYNACMRPYMTGGGTDRKTRFCVGAKLCSGKARNEEEAKELCSQPKPPKAVKVGKVKRGQSCEKNAQQVAECVVGRLTTDGTYKEQAMNINSVGAAITNALIECQCPQR